VRRAVKHVQFSDSEKPTSYTRIYIFAADSVYEMQNGERRALALEALKRLGHGYDVTSSQLRWSNTAGCSCGCSPGFIVKGLRGMSVFVDIE
jgi:hypothetical protein